MSFYLNLYRGKKFDQEFIQRLRISTLVMVSTITKMNQTLRNQQDLYLMIAPSECDSDTRIQSTWAFEIKTPRTMGQIVNPSKILKRTERDVEVDSVHGVYTNSSIVARLLADMNAKPHCYDRLRYINEQFRTGVGKLADIEDFI